MLKTILILSFLLFSQCFLNNPSFIPINNIIDFNNHITTTEFLTTAVYYDSSRECDDDCQSAEQILFSFSDEFEGIIKFTKSDCAILKIQDQLDNFPICRYPDKLPALVFYKPPEQKFSKLTQEKQFPEELFYGNPSNAASLKEFAKGKIPTYRTLISNQHELEEFFNYYDLPMKVLLFTDARETSTMFKGLNAQFKDRLDFGEIRVIRKEQEKIAKEFSISNYPSLLVVEVGPHGKIKQTHLFKEKANFLNVMDFLKPFARTNQITRPSDQFKSNYPQIERISAQNFSDLILENPNVVFVHFSIHDEEHYAWKELITKLGPLFEYFEMNCTLPENLDYIEKFSKQQQKYFPLIGYFPKGEKGNSESSLGYFLNFHKPDDIFHDLAVLMSNNTETFAPSNAKEFLQKALEEKRKPYLLLFPSSVYSNEMLLFKSISLQQRFYEKLNFAVYSGDPEPLKQILKFNTIPTMISIFGQDGNQDQRLGSFKLPFDLENMILYCNDMIESFFKFRFVQTQLVEVTSQEIFEQQCPEDGQYCFIAFFDGRKRQQQDNKIKENEIIEQIDLLFKVESIFKNKNKQISIGWMDGYCYLEVLSIFDMTMHQLPFIIAINSSKEKFYFIELYQIMKKGFNIENIEDFILKVKRNKGKAKKLPMIDIDTKNCAKIKPKGYQSDEL